jgi:glycosyltransferase involved in cell wall biosynthesis
MKLSVSMIVKNEESCLRTCLESVKEAEEIVVVDTGSKDKTLEIAKQYTDKVYSGEEYLWRDDFAFSRNQSLEKCTGDWILIIDADEYLEPGAIKKIREAISKTKKKALRVKTVARGTKTTHKSIRVFKAGEGIKWVGAIHNYLSTTDADEVDTVLTYGYSPAHKLDPNRALRILTKVVEENPECSREKYYLAREYWYRKDYTTAVKWYDEYLKVAKWLPERADGYLTAARCLWQLHRGDEARQYCMNAILINANFKEALLFMAELSWEKNAKMWKKFAEFANNEDVLFVRT